MLDNHRSLEVKEQRLSMGELRKEVEWSFEMRGSWRRDREGGNERYKGMRSKGKCRGRRIGGSMKGFGSVGSSV